MAEEMGKKLEHVDQIKKIFFSKMGIDASFDFQSWLLNLYQNPNTNHIEAKIWGYFSKLD